MYIYSVTITIEKTAEKEWVSFMQDKHIADVLNTGVFYKACMRKIINTDNASSVYNMEYYCNTKEDSDKYQQEFAPALQQDVRDKFAGKSTAGRIFYEQVFEL